MDALALLCTLHADGPTSLRELRSAGCENLLDFVRSSAQELAQVLCVSIASAERLQREAHLLGQRIVLLEPEDASSPHAELRQEAIEKHEVVPPPAPEEPRIEIPIVVAALPPALACSRAHRSWFNATRIPLAPVRRREEMPVIAALVSPMPDPPKRAEPQQRSPLAGETVPARTIFVARDPVLTTHGQSTLGQSTREQLIPFSAAIGVDPVARAKQRSHLPVTVPADAVEARPIDVGPTALTAALETGELDGLDANLLEALASADIHTVEALVEASGLDLSRKLSLPFTRLLELQLGAQHLYKKSTAVDLPKAERKSKAVGTEGFSASSAPGRRHTDSDRVPPSERTIEIALKPDVETLVNIPVELESEPDGSAAGPFA